MPSSWKSLDWWYEKFPDDSGRRHCDVQLWEIADRYGDVTKEGWGWRRSTTMERNKEHTFPALSTGVAASRERIRVTPLKGSNSYQETTEILEDGAYRSDKLLTMSDEQSKDPLYLLEAHGFDCGEWEILKARNNIWNVHSQQDGVQTLYSSTITVKPLRDSLCLDELVAAVCLVEPVIIEQPALGERLLEVAITDAHFGNSTFDWYLPSLTRIHEIITSRTWAQVLIPIGSDLYHCDNFKNTTSNGTPQSSVSWPDAWSDALRFYSTIIEAALKHSAEVYCDYIPGNHDESMSWAFCQMLTAKYPQVRFDTAITERKVHTFADIAIGMTHGDGRTRKDLDRVFVSEFPDFARAKVREVHAGHYHHEMTKDQFGVVVRSLSTAARTDKWHREEGFVGACKRFQLFEFEADALAAIRYV